MTLNVFAYNEHYPSLRLNCARSITQWSPFVWLPIAVRAKKQKKKRFMKLSQSMMITTGRRGELQASEYVNGNSIVLPFVCPASCPVCLSVLCLCVCACVYVWVVRLLSGMFGLGCVMIEADSSGSLVMLNARACRPPRPGIESWLQPPLDKKNNSTAQRERKSIALCQPGSVCVNVLGCRAKK